MKNLSPDVDAYIASAPEFARPILDKIRAAFHAGCPELEERIKWGVPSFEHKCARMQVISQWSRVRFSDSSLDRVL